MTWFERLTGIAEGPGQDVAAQLVSDGPWLTSLVNGRRLRAGDFELVSLGTLRDRLAAMGGGRISAAARPLRVRELVADVRRLHAEPAAAGATFQVASQFNMLEMVSPEVEPEAGVGRYELDPTQGPACAVACGAGTIYRNYLVPVGGGAGQRRNRQLDGLAALAGALGIQVEMRNGYALPTAQQLATVADLVARLDQAGRDELISQLAVGVQWSTEVTEGDAGHLVTQVFCSALPLAYAGLAGAVWEPFAGLVLDGAYEATLAVAALNAARPIDPVSATGANPTVYLTLVGGGAFGNPTPWILNAVRRALDRFPTSGLDVVIVSHRQSNALLRPLLSAPVATRWADELLSPPPPRWGLRGDPHLWAELSERLRPAARPATVADFEALLVNEVAALIGTDLLASEAEAIRVDRYPTSGMSGGFVSPPFWRSTLIPLLLSRFRLLP